MKKKNTFFVIQNGTKCSKESRKHKVSVTEILRYALDDKLKWFKLLSLILLSFACTPQPKNVTDTTEPAPIYPDYTDITIPYNIAPLNFLLRNEAEAIHVTLQGETESWSIQSDNHQVCFPLKKWHEFMKANQG